MAKKEYVVVNDGKIRAQMVAKKRTASDVCRKAGLTKSYYSDSINKSGKIEKTKFMLFCKELGISPKYYILETTKEKKKIAKTSTPKAVVKKDVKIEDKPLTIHLKEYNELSELIEVQKEIRDALRELVTELKRPAINVDNRPKAYLKKENENGNLRN